MSTRRTGGGLAALGLFVGCGGPSQPTSRADGRLDRLFEAAADPSSPVRFVVLGDGGKGNPGQYAVAQAVKTVCEARRDRDGPGCVFALYLGDNIYDEGVESPTDPQFQSKFEQPYADLDFPFLVVLGNHDYGSTSLAGWRAEPQVLYSEHSSKWTLPARYYQAAVGPHRFVGLDTNALLLQGVWGESEQAAWLQQATSAPTLGWTIAFGHHPYRSNGQHGNAGNYEGLAWLPVVRGSGVEGFFADRVCGNVDLYFSGHDHNLQWLEPTCGTHFIVSGAAARTTPLERRDHNPVLFEDDQHPGFVWVELRGDSMTGVFYDQEAQVLFEHTVQRPLR